MDHAGVDVAVLQNDVLYGKLTDFFYECSLRYPGRFLLAAHVDETSLASPEALEELHRATEQLGHRGLFPERCPAPAPKAWTRVRVAHTDHSPDGDGWSPFRLSRFRQDDQGGPLFSDTLISP